MDQNQPTVDNDLQKAIDDITNTTNIDPVFSDPVAAPSSVPEGDTGELSEPVGPFPAPEPAPVQAPEQMNQPAPMPEMAPELAAQPAPAPMPEQPVAPMPEMAPAPEVAPMPEQPVAPAPEAPISEPVIMTATETITEAPASALNMRQVKEAALRDLTPLINRLNMNASQKFSLYKDIFENMRDYSVLEPAYYAAKEIADESERAEALLYLVEAIDKL